MEKGTPLKLELGVAAFALIYATALLVQAVWLLFAPAETMPLPGMRKQMGHPVAVVALLVVMLSCIPFLLVPRLRTREHITLISRLFICLAIILFAASFVLGSFLGGAIAFGMCGGGLLRSLKVTPNMTVDGSRR